MISNSKVYSDNLFLELTIPLYLNCLIFSLARDQMKRTIEYVKTQNSEKPEDIRKEIKNFRDKRLSEEQQEQSNVITFI